MKEGWEIKKLGEIAYIGLGFTHTPEYVESGVPFLSVKDISSGEICWENVKFVSQEEYDSAPKGAKPQKGDIMFCRVGTMGKPVIVTTDTPFCTFVSLGYLHLLNNNISNIYIKYWMQSNAFDIQVKANVKGVAIKNLNTGWLKEFTLPIPPIAEQEKIVAELDCLSGIIEKKKQQLKEYDALAQSIFYEMFGDPVENEKGWEMYSIDSLCSSIVRGPFGSALKKEFFIEPNPTAYKVYEQKHAIHKNAEIGTYYISAERFETLSRFEIKVGDIIMSCSGTIGEFFEIPIGAEKGLMNQALLKFTLNDHIEKIYFLYAMEWVKENFDKKGSGLQNIGSVGTIKKTQISLPTLTEQSLFASKIEAIEKQKALIKKSIEEVETLFNSRMDLYFN